LPNAVKGKGGSFPAKCRRPASESSQLDLFPQPERLIPSMDSVVFICGTHGTGKSSIARMLIEEGFHLFHGTSDDHGNPCTTSTYRRQAWRLAQYFADAMELLEQHLACALAERCILDWVCYTETFHRLNWLTSREYKKLMDCWRTLFDREEIKPVNVIYVAPPVDWTKARIIERWNSEKRKWNEADFNYLTALSRMYDEVFCEQHVRQLLRLTTTDSQKRLDLAREFIVSLRFAPERKPVPVPTQGRPSVPSVDTATWLN
jgi:deoxyadenosine/deoxycytidine kinase